MSKSIGLPPAELSVLSRRLAAGLRSYTTRVGAELGRCGMGEVLASPLGLLAVVDVHRSKLPQHPFLAELTAEQKKQIGSQVFDLIRFSRHYAPEVRDG